MRKLRQSFECVRVCFFALPYISLCFLFSLTSYFLLVCWYKRTQNMLISRYRINLGAKFYKIAYVQNVCSICVYVLMVTDWAILNRTKPFLTVFVNPKGLVWRMKIAPFWWNIHFFTQHTQTYAKNMWEKNIDIHIVYRNMYNPYWC